MAEIFARDSVSGHVSEVALPAVVSAHAPDADRVNGQLVQEGTVLGIDQPKHRVVKIHPKVFALKRKMF